MPSWEVLELPRRLVMLQGPEAHLYARFGGVTGSADWAEGSSGHSNIGP